MWRKDYRWRNILLLLVCIDNSYEHSYLSIKSHVLHYPFYYRTCTTRDNSVLCERCYRGTNHRGHNVVTRVNHNACTWCDCGDLDYWKEHLNCKYHSSNVSHTRSSQCGAKIAVGEAYYR